jgi:hypothetical protein
MKHPSSFAEILVAAALVCGPTACSLAAPTYSPPVPDAAASVLLSDAVMHEGVTESGPAVEQEAFAALLSGGQFDWVVAPFQVQSAAVDLSQRSIMAADVARALVARGLRVADPTLVARALGERRRSLDLNAVYQLCNKLGARNLIVGFVGHDPQSHLLVTLKIQSPPGSAGASAPYVSWSDLSYSADNPPFSVFHAHLPDFLAALRIPGATPAPHPVRASAFTFPETPAGLATSHGDNPLDDAVRLAILSELAPPNTRSAERLLERVLLSIEGVDTSQDASFLRAYAMLHLNMRPAALREVQAVRAPAAQALLRIINGNVPGTAELVHRTAGYERFILELELRDLEAHYDNERLRPLPALLEHLSKRNGTWAALLGRRWTKFFIREPSSNEDLEQVLNAEYPLPGVDLEEALARRAATPGQEVRWTDVELLAVNHIRRLMADQRARWCCEHSFVRVNDWDVVAVIEGWAELTASWQIDFAERVGQRTDALRMLVELEPYYLGNPYFDVRRARLNFELAAGSQGPEHESYLAAARHFGITTLVLSGGQTIETVEILRLLWRSDPRVVSFGEAYSGDYPLKLYWTNGPWLRGPEKNLAFAREVLANTQADPQLAKILLFVGGDAVKSEVTAELKDRFQGSPQLAEVQAMAAAPGWGPAPEEALRAAVRAAPDAWEGYDKLWTYLAHKGDTAGAIAVLESFPEFHAKNPGDTVALSNRAAAAGHWYYWHGLVPEAARLYRLAVRYDTGADSDMVARVRLQLMAGDYGGALDAARARAERWPKDAAYRDYLTLLHVLGRSAEAWSSFKALLGQPYSALWESAMVGHRIAQTTPEQLNAWLEDPQIRGPANGPPVAAAYLLQWTVTDREATPDVADRIRSLAREPRGTAFPGRVASYRADEGERRVFIKNSDFRADARPPQIGVAPTDSFISLYGAAIAPLFQKDYLGAVGKFDQLAARFPIEGSRDDSSYEAVLAYFAYSAAKTGDTLGLESFLKTFPETSQGFDYFLAAACFQALQHKDNAAALKSLDRAFFAMEHDVSHIPSPEYQFADIAERLYRDTGDARFKTLALNWVRDYRRAQPIMAWAYAVEAELASSPAERETALLAALYLDPLSPRLRMIPAEELSAARQRLSEQGPPFRSSRPAHKSSSALNPVRFEINYPTVQ